MIKTTAQKLGFAVSMAALGSFLLYTICFAVILAVNPPFSWNGIEGFAVYEAANETLWKYLGIACMLLYACAFPVMVLCAGEAAEQEKRLYSRIAALFSAAFSVTVCINYFVQLTATRLQLKAGSTDSLLQITQSYNISAINAVNMLGWTLFYALASLALSALFDGSKWGRAAKFFALFNTLLMFIGFAGYFLNHFLTLALVMNLGLGGAGFGMALCMMFWFRKRSKA